MFQFPRLPPTGLCVRPAVTGNDSRRVRPFGDPRVERASAPNRGLSQLVTSFVGFLCQGIHRLPLPSSLSDSMESNILSCAPLPGREMRSSLRKIFRHAMQLSRYGEGEPSRPDTARPGGRDEGISGTGGDVRRHVVLF